MRTISVRRQKHEDVTISITHREKQKARQKVPHMEFEATSVRNIMLWHTCRSPITMRCLLNHMRQVHDISEA